MQRDGLYGGHEKHGERQRSSKPKVVLVNGDHTIEERLVQLARNIDARRARSQLPPSLTVDVVTRVFLRDVVWTALPLLTVEHDCVLAYKMLRHFYPLDIDELALKACKYQPANQGTPLFKLESAFCSTVRGLGEVLPHGTRPSKLNHSTAVLAFERTVDYYASRKGITRQAAKEELTASGHPNSASAWSFEDYRMFVRVNKKAQLVKTSYGRA